MLYGYLIIGPAGSGKSTFCNLITQYEQLLNRKIHIINLDPSNDQLQYKPLIDINDLISTQDVIEELSLGPNGGLVFCLEYLIDNFEFLGELIEENVFENEYVFFDCPGQIELYTHLDCFQKLIRKLQNQIGFVLGTAYIMDVQILGDYHKYVSSLMMAMTSMLQLGLPHTTIISKLDLIDNKQIIDDFQDMLLDDNQFIQDVQNRTVLDQKINRLAKVLRQMVVDHDLVFLSKLDMTDEESITSLVYNMDLNIGYGDNKEPDDRVFDLIDQKQQDI